MSHVCKYCGKEFDNYRKLGGHIVYCNNNPNRRTKEKQFEIGAKNRKKANYKTYTFVCEVCGKEYQLELSENSYNKGKYKKTCSDKCAKKLTAQHTNKEEKNKKISASSIGKISPKKGTTNHILYDDNNKRYFHTICKHCGKEFYSYSNTSYCSDYCKSFAWKTCGGLRQNSYKQYKSGWYRGIHCDSSWELAFVMYHLDHNLNIKRNTQYRTYLYNNKQYKYYPDFITDEGIIEIKGYISEKWKAKIKQNPDIKVLYRTDMKLYLDYAISKYGKDFIQFYDKRDKTANIV